jgi:hypothetical protein
VTQLIDGVSQMQEDMSSFTQALEQRAAKTSKIKAPCRHLTASLLRVSRFMHAQAAKVFYGGNTFYFPWSTTSWMQLESFLATIGPQNVALLRNLRVHAPLWYLGLQADFLEGSILDLTSPASRLAVNMPPGEL